MKKLLPIIFAILILSGLTGCKEKEIKIIQATDMHYLSSELTDNSPEFVDMLLGGDGKMTHYIDEIMDAFVDDVIEAKPNYLFLSGDMTFNGEKLSHLDLVEKLEKVRKAGVTVLVIPGNHDIDYPFSMGFKDGYSYQTDRFLKADYEATYQDYGLAKASTRDEETFSYFYPLSKDIQVLMLDVNTGVEFGKVSDKTLEWIKENLEASTQKGIRTIVVSHQNLLHHSETLQSGFSIKNGEQLSEIFKEYDVKLNLSGHTHVQNIKDSEQKLYDVVTSSLAVYPSQYGMITISPKTFEIEYNTEKTKISQWAQKNSIEDDNLKDFESYSLQFFTDVSYYKLYNQLDEQGLTDKEREAMAMLFAQMNNHYFPGTLQAAADQLKNSEGYALWQNHPELRQSQYITKALNEEQRDHTKLSIK